MFKVTCLPNGFISYLKSQLIEPYERLILLDQFMYLVIYSVGSVLQCFMCICVISFD